MPRTTRSARKKAPGRKHQAGSGLTSSRVICSIIPSAASSRPYCTSARPTATPRMIFSCCRQAAVSREEDGEGWGWRRQAGAAGLPAAHAALSAHSCRQLPQICSGPRHRTMQYRIIPHHTIRYRTCVSCAYASSSAALSVPLPANSRPRLRPAASPATAAPGHGAGATVRPPQHAAKWLGHPQLHTITALPRAPHMLLPHTAGLRSRPSRRGTAPPARDSLRGNRPSRIQHNPVPTHPVPYRNRPSQILHTPYPPALSM